MKLSLREPNKKVLRNCLSANVRCIIRVKRRVMLAFSSCISAMVIRKNVAPDGCSMNFGRSTNSYMITSEKEIKILEGKKSER